MTGIHLMGALIFFVMLMIYSRLAQIGNAMREINERQKGRLQAENAAIRENLR